MVCWGAGVEKAVLRLINVPLTDGWLDALVSFTFSLGVDALQRPTLRVKINRQVQSEVPEQFMRWVLAGGKRLPGLAHRRATEVESYRNLRPLYYLLKLDNDLICSTN